jgi:hypothetical protein
MKMTNNQKWAAIVFSFILLLAIIAGGFTYGILNSPAATSKIDIDADIMLSQSKDGKLELEYIHFNRIYGEVNERGR